MLVAKDPFTNTFVNAFDYKHISPEERPNGLLWGVFNCLCIRHFV